MKSGHGDLYNHDNVAAGYDADVQRDNDPIREGYDALLDWVAETAQVSAGQDVVELGSGTGNLTVRLPPTRSLVCVDISVEMSAIARAKLGVRPGLSFAQQDLLAYVHGDGPAFDVLVSTYAIHHLTEEEKGILFRRVADRLRPGGRMVVGDLMVRDAAAEAELVARFRAEGDAGTARDIEEEFFWHLDDRVTELKSLGFRVHTRRFSTLSFGLAALRR